MRVAFILFACLLAGLKLRAADTDTHTYVIAYTDSSGQVLAWDTLASTTELQVQNLSDGRPNPVRQLFKKKQRLNKRITAAVLAFPFPFGIVGLHRIYLGTKPYVPVVYIATVGGVFGILPFIDFCVLMFDKDFERYKNNGKIFMWIKS